MDGGKQMPADLVACGVGAAFFGVLGLLLVNGKCLTLVAGYFAATPEQRKAYDKKAMGRFAGVLMFFFAACILLIMLAIALELAWMSRVVIALVIIGGIGAAIYANTGDRFKTR